ncbi:glycosyl transferase [Bifidobacterium pseudolongum subsp. globosum]|uniref:Glycosyl transferase n=1 Tax=Bifidobacterium pseudolongum subsp. globosum TaxID=1690 RepID=A0A2N3QDW7_9BIFI|nr:DUF4422 domain-containing protein [Bifidobacterium pseudolongum]PKU88282.1 glycosyl transferase [Bifidobacterium pseudolongum subsp. globosum]
MWEGMSGLDITIAVAMHKQYARTEDTVYLPVHVGAALHPEVLTDITQDNTGENISQLNPYFSELTAMYWLWKNNDSDYKGIVHYRRYFASPSLRKRLSRNRFDRILSRQELEPLLAKNNVILPSKRRYFIETIYSHYDHTLHADQLHQTRNVLKNMAPEYVGAWDALMRKRSAHIFNMMIMDKADFNAYCEWLFPILFELTHRIDSSNYSPFHARYPGRISEILLNVWISTNHITYRTVPTVYTERVNWWKKGTGFLKAKFFKKKYDASF